MLTEIAVRNLKPRGEMRYEVPDGNGLFVAVHPTGRKSYVVRFRVDGKPKKLTLSKGLTLAEARVEAAAARLKAERKQDPTAEKKEQRKAQQAADATTFKSVADLYLALEESKKDGARLRSLGWRRQALERLVYPVIGAAPIRTIKRSEIIALLNKIELGQLDHPVTGKRMRGGATMAHGTLAIVRTIFNWHQVQDDDFRSPIVRGMARIKADQQQRDRVLSDDELRAIWKTAEQRVGDSYCALVQFLLLTGARRSEAAGLPRVGEIKDGIWTLPAARNKVKVDLVRPLSAAAMAVLESLPEVDGGCGFFFSRGQRPVASFGRFKEEFDAASGVRGWRIHDLRRTARTLMSRAGVNPDHAEACLGHVLPTIRKTYDRFQFLDEKRRAFDALAALIDRIAHPPGGTVTEMRRERQAR